MTVSVSTLCAVAMCALMLMATASAATTASAVGAARSNAESVRGTARFSHQLSTVVSRASRQGCERKYQTCINAGTCSGRRRKSCERKAKNKCCACSLECRKVSRWIYRNTCYNKAKNLGRKC